MNSLIPEFMDEVKSKINETFGIVAAKYQWRDKWYVDIRVDNRMYYHSPIENWEVVRKYEA